MTVPEYHTFKDSSHPGVHRVYLEEPWGYVGKVTKVIEFVATLWLAETESRQFLPVVYYKTRKAAAEALVQWHTGGKA